MEEAQRITMDEFRGIQTSLFLMLLLQFTGAATGQRVLHLTVRDGDEATLSCRHVTDDQNNCDRTTWIYSNLSSRPAVELVTAGQIGKQAEDKSDRLSVTENCSLVIKKVTEEDAGYYDCRWISSGQLQGAVVFLYVITMTEQKNSDEVTLTCSVSIYDLCRYTVNWLFQGQYVDKDNRDLKTSQSLCSASVTFKMSHYIHTSRNKSLICDVTDGDKVQLFPFRPSGEDTTTPTRSGNSTEAAWWRFIIVSVGLAALIITVVAINVWRRIKEKKTQTDEITVRYDADDDTVNYENIRSPDGV